MEQPAHCSLARAYVTHSNDHDVDAIRRLLHADARYESAYAGTISGRDTILEMMQTFFREFPDVRWDADTYEKVAPGRVAFDFRMQATDSNGRHTCREGRELIEFTAQGLISFIRVGGREAAPRG